ncbi:MAG: PKD domain-containing protein [Saprospirales bacterium]|nr:PKD domain-containing protein [Saprospirales bacterium]
MRTPGGFVPEYVNPDSLMFYDWFFGDGGGDTIQNPTHVYYATGGEITTYTVILVADNGCAKDTMSLEITVFPAPEVSF